MRFFLAWMGLFLSLSAAAQSGVSEESVNTESAAILSEELEEQQLAEVVEQSAQTAPVEATVSAEPATKTNAQESEIPVLTAKAKENTKSSDPTQRLAISFAVLIAVAGGLFLFSRFWAKRKSGLAQHHQIKVLTQYSLGPKKNLAIVRVAGESILIGITDHNISMIKSLSLIDDEFPEEVPQQFAAEMSQQVQTPEEDFAFASVRDRVSTRIKQMRSL